MKTTIKCILGLFVLMVCLTGCGESTPVSSFGILNKTSVTIYDVYVKLPTGTDWGKDLLSNDLPTGTYFTANLSEPLNIENRYDILLFGANGTSFLMSNVKVSKNKKITLSDENKVAGEVVMFSTDFETENHGWTIVNGNQINKWWVGQATANSGTRSIYISNDNGNSHRYNTGSNSITHFYREIYIPSNLTGMRLDFNYIAGGERSFDYLTVHLSNQPPSAGNIPNGTRIGMAQYRLSGGWRSSAITLPTYAAGFTGYLIFTWQNDGSDGTQPPVAIDDIALTIVGQRDGDEGNDPISMLIGQWVGYIDDGNLTFTINANGTGTMSFDDLSSSYEGETSSFTWTLHNKTSLNITVAGNTETLTIIELSKTTFRVSVDGEDITFTKTQAQSR